MIFRKEYMSKTPYIGACLKFYLNKVIAWISCLCSHLGMKNFRLVNSHIHGAST